LQGVKAALQGGAHLVYAKSCIAGEYSNASALNTTSQVNIDCVNIETAYGYPEADSFAITPFGVIAFHANDEDYRCQVDYTEAGDSNSRCFLLNIRIKLVLDEQGRGW
jgi:hypothetical protein